MIPKSSIKSFFTNSLNGNCNSSQNIKCVISIIYKLTSIFRMNVTKILYFLFELNLADFLSPHLDYNLNV